MEFLTTSNDFETCKSINGQFTIKKVEEDTKSIMSMIIMDGFIDTFFSSPLIFIVSQYIASNKTRVSYII